jgi:Kef-type K+ transport system membrane component KefB
MSFPDHPVLTIAAVAVLAPLLAEIPVGVRVPVVVLEVLLGILIGPHVLGLVEPNQFLSTMQLIGTAAMLFMAGSEIDFEKIRGPALSLALRGWMASVVLAIAAAAVLQVARHSDDLIMVTIALTTTSLGALLPMLRDDGQLESPFGRLLLAAGTVGEVGPIVAVSLALSGRYTTAQEFGFLVAFLALVGLSAAVGIAARPPRLLALLERTMHASTQLPVRLALFVVTALFVLATEFGFEGILGAFAAGMVIGLVTRGEEGETFRVKVDAVCFGWFTPFFFVGTGIQFDPGALARDPTTIFMTPAFLLLFLLVRGAPVLLYRAALPRAERPSFGLCSSVASLGLVVVITEIGLRSKSMSPDIAQALIAASLLSLLLFPALSAALLPKAAPATRGAR